jgi:nicotinamidase-related amidase
MKKQKRRVELNSDETTLIIIDMQKDFCCLDGKLYFEGCQRVIPAVRTLAEKAIEKGVVTIFTFDKHKQGDPEFTIWGEHCLEGSEGAALVADFGEISKKASRVESGNYNKFLDSNLGELLEAKRIKNTVFAGILTNICILYTATEGSRRGYGIVIPRDCVSTRSDYEQKYAIHQLSLFGSVITDSQKINFV